MTRKEIIRKITREVEGVTQHQTKEIINKTFDAIIDTLVREGRIELRNFGIFEVKQRPAYEARNPQDNAPVYVDAKNVVKFKAGKEMQDRLREIDFYQSMETINENTPKEMPLESEHTEDVLDTLFFDPDDEGQASEMIGFGCGED